MTDTHWTQAERKLARQVFESALSAELAEVVADFKMRAADVTEPGELWEFPRS